MLASDFVGAVANIHRMFDENKLLEVAPSHERVSAHDMVEELEESGFNGLGGKQILM